jgi:lipoprotein-releasing system permease protein
LNLSYFISKKIISSRSQGFASTIHTIAMFSIGLGLASVIVSFLIMKGFQETVKEKMYTFSGHMIITKFSMNNSLEEFPMSYNIEIYNEQKKFPFIQHVQEYAHKPGLIKTDDEVVGVYIKGVGKSFDQKTFQQNMLEGEFIHFPDSGYSSEVVLSRTIANTLNSHVGDEIMVHFFQNPPRVRKLKVVGIYETNLAEYYDSKIILGDIRLIQRLNDWTDSIAGGLEVSVNRDAYRRSDLMKEHIEFVLSSEELSDAGFFKRAAAMLGAWWSFDQDKAGIEKARQEIGMLNDYDQNLELIEEKYLQVFEWLNLISRQVNILLGVILAVVSVNMISIVLILVMERTQMIGMLKALGARDGLVRSIFIYNGVHLILRGLLVGNIIGLGLCFIQDKFKIIKLNPRDYYMSFVPISWHWDVVLILNVMTLFVVTIILLLPTMAISKISPIKAIRFD